MKNITMIKPDDTITLKINDSTYELSIDSEDALDYVNAADLDNIFNNGEDQIPAVVDWANQIWIEYIIENFDEVFDAGYTVDDLRDEDDPGFTSESVADIVMEVFKPTFTWYLNGEEMYEPIDSENFYTTASIYFGENELDVDEFVEMVEDYND